MLVAENLHFKIGETPIIKDVSLEVTPGELTVIVGSNGAGKSTLLRLLTGESKPNSGQIFLNEKPLQSIPFNELAKCRAVLPQSSSLSFPFKVEEVVLMGRSPHKGAGYKKDQQIVEEVLTLVDTLHLKDRVYTTLSGGESQRVQLARVIAQIWQKQNNEARYLLLDEPTSALDLAHQHNTLDIAQKFAHQENIAVLAVLHDLNLSALYADKIIMMKNGNIVKTGTPEEVLKEHLIEEAFNLEVKVIPHPVHRNCPLVVATAH